MGDCTPCRQGKSCNGKNTTSACPNGLYSPVGVADCLPIPPGYRDDTSTNGEIPTPCPVNQFATQGATTCSACPAGLYRPLTGSACLSCPAGHTCSSGSPV